MKKVISENSVVVLFVVIDLNLWLHRTYSNVELTHSQEKIDKVANRGHCNDVIFSLSALSENEE